MYKLAAELRGHEDDVRGVTFPQHDVVVSASRDATVRHWALISDSPPKYDGTLSSHGQGFVNCVTFIPTSSDHPQGLIVSGGQDGIIELRQPGKAPQDNAERMLLGHTGNVCAVDVSVEGQFVVSGSWDSSARVWPFKTWETSAILEGHEAAVWAVLAYDAQTIVTACADQYLRVFHPSGKLIRKWKASDAPLRALCRVPPGHASGAELASTGNDNIIRLWTRQGGRPLAELHGHENFVYSLASLPAGEIVSSGEDRTVRIWRGNQCIQTITHPSISVWDVAVCAANGDIVSGSSDRIVRVFTQDSKRHADPPTLQAFEDSVKSSSIPKQTVEGGVNKEKLPGPDFLTQRSGTKEGQVQMIREHNGNVTAHQWSSAAQQWVSIGTVVDSAGSSGRKQEFQGKDYDYVFDVDIEDGKPPLKLPYNLSQNVYEVAQKFIADNELPGSYIEQVANFIITNTQGANIGQQSQPTARDAWGTGSRYIPGEVGSATLSQPAQQQPPPMTKSKVLPQTQYLSISTGNLAMMQKKVEEFNQQLIEAGNKDVALNPDAITILATTTKQLQQHQTTPSKPLTVSTDGIDIIMRIATQWPAEKRLPGLDLLRLLAAGSSTLVTHTTSDSEPESTIITTLIASDSLSDPERPNNLMLGIRTFANLFSTPEGRAVVDSGFDAIHELVEPYLTNPTANRNLTIAIATLYINYSVLISGTGAVSGAEEPKSPAGPNADRALALLDGAIKILSSAEDTEALYRALVAAGTLLALGEDFRTAAREVFELDTALERAIKVGGREERVKGVVSEMREELK